MQKPNANLTEPVIAKSVHIAMPVRWSVMGQQSRGPAEMACTYDIHSTGARLVGSRHVNIGDLILVERGRNKAICQVTWAADPNSPLRGQFAVQCVEGRTPWNEELRQAEEQFQPLEADEDKRRSLARSSMRDSNRRRRPRYSIEGHAEVIEGVQHAAGEVIQISEFGARISSTEMLRPGTDFELMLNIFDVSLALKAQVKNVITNIGMGVEFQEIRRGDRPLLGYVLSRVKSRRLEEFVEVEVVTDRLVGAVAG